MRLPLPIIVSILAFGCEAANGELTGADESNAVANENALTGERVVGSNLRTTANLNLREGAGTSFPILLVMPQSTLVIVREAAPVNGFYAVKYAEKDGWAAGAYLASADIVPLPPAAAVRIGGAVRTHVQGFANASCGSAGGCPFEINTYNGHQPTSDRAIDMMQGAYGKIPNSEGIALGTKIADFGVANGASHRVDYVIWRQRINSLDGRGWRGMPDRGSITQNHYDHVHVSFEP